jgi:hypothetical protein
MWPQEGLGAGAFTVLFKNTVEGQAAQIDSAVWGVLGRGLNRQDAEDKRSFKREVGGIRNYF